MCQFVHCITIFHIFLVFQKQVSSSFVSSIFKCTLSLEQVR